MMTLDPEVLSAARAARERMLERQHELERARADLNHEIRRLHAGGGSMRAISEQLGVSHQRVHQIVAEGGDGEADSLLRRLGGRLRGSVGGAFTRFTKEARGVVERAHEEALELGSASVEPEHLLLALTTPGAGGSERALSHAGVTYEALRAAVRRSSDPPSEADSGGMRMAFADASTKALELSLKEALRRGDNHINSEHVLLGLLRDADARTVALLDEVDAKPNAIREALEASSR